MKMLIVMYKNVNKTHGNLYVEFLYPNNLML